MAAGLNIAALTKRTGVPPDTIRKWEQRYGVLAPERTAGGQRRYSELDVERIEWLKARLEEGYRIGEAAALLGAGGEVVPSSADALRAAFLDAALHSDTAALARVVQQSLALGSPADAFAAVLTPALVEVGERWEAGELSVGQEHLATAVVRTSLQRLLSDTRPGVRGTAVLACAPGEQHDVGLLMLSVLLRGDGWEIAYLGADTPVDEATALAARLGAGALCFSTSREETARELARGLAGKQLAATVVVGGRVTDAPPELERTVQTLREAT